MRNIARLLFLITLIVTFQPAYSQNITETEGTWIIDLRPTPDSEPYLKEFLIKDITTDSLNKVYFSGTFYETDFTGGRLNDSWEIVYFAFSTSDGNNSYFHSGYFKDGIVYGTSYSPERNLLIPWKGEKQKI
jgi:hypothetical protein